MVKFLAVILVLVASSWALPLTEEELHFEIQDALIRRGGVALSTPVSRQLNYQLQ